MAKRIDKPSPGLVKAMSERKPVLPSEKLEKLKGMVRDARDLQIRIANGNELLGKLNGEFNEYKTKTIPDYMEGLGVPSITVDMGGNEPPFTARVRAYYKANIEADWPEEKRQEAFDYLKEIGHDDLIKTYVSFAFPKGVTTKEIEQFTKAVKAIKIKAGKTFLGIPIPEIERGVHWGTLTSWLKDQVERVKFIPDLDKIGAKVGKIAVIEEVKTDNNRSKQ